MINKCLKFYLILSSICRTGYQGKNFEMLQMEMRRKPVQSIEEMIQENFTFYVFPNFLKTFGSIDLVRR